MKIVIKGFIETSLVDWEGRIVSTLYVPYCNFRGPFCQNSGLILNPEQYETIPVEVIINYLIKRKGWIDGVCLTGGEPCLYEDVIDFIEKIRATGMKLKLDTNGTFPDVLRKIIEMKIVDFVAMDIKAPLEEEAYSNSIGVKSKKILGKVKESISIIMHSDIDYEFRTTVVPSLHEKEDVCKIAQYIKGAKRYALQNFVPQNTLDPEYMKIKPYGKSEMDEIYREVFPYVKECRMRGV